MNTRSNNYLEHLHNEDYEIPYLSNVITYKDMINDSGRERESLNGWWNFQVDPVDTCIRAKWYEVGNRKNIHGNPLPLDYNFIM